MVGVENAEQHHLSGWETRLQPDGIECHRMDPIIWMYGKAFTYQADNIIADGIAGHCRIFMVLSRGVSVVPVWWSRSIKHWTIDSRWALALDQTPKQSYLLWGLLYFSKTKNIMPVKIFGDSKVIVYWAKGLHDLHIIQLNCWIRRTKELIDFFQNSSFSHIYWEHNSEADILSKQAIGDGMETIKWAKLEGTTVLEQGSLNTSLAGIWMYVLTSLSILRFGIQWLTL